MFETETAAICLVQKLKWGEGYGAPGSPSDYAPVKSVIALLSHDNKECIKQKSSKCT